MRELDTAGKTFLVNQARILKQSEQPATLETLTNHSIINGKVYEVEDGGLVFLELGTNRMISIPWNSVGYLVALPPTQVQ